VVEVVDIKTNHEKNMTEALLGIKKVGFILNPS
jgi:hypothetical protein